MEPASELMTSETKFAIEIDVCEVVGEHYSELVVDFDVEKFGLFVLDDSAHELARITVSFGLHFDQCSLQILEL